MRNVVNNMVVLILISVLFLSCDRSESVDPVEVEDPNWIKLEIPEGREAYAIVGDINERLLVTTWTKAFYSDDKGLTWNESYNFNGPVFGLLERNDTVFSLILNNNSFASVCNDYTTDYGKTWEKDRDGTYSQLTIPIRSAQSNTGVMYRVKENLTPIHEGATTFYVNPSDIEKTEANFSGNILLPSRKLKIHNIFLGKNNYLYLAASSGTFNENNVHVCCDPNSPALIYISREALP